MKYKKYTKVVPKNVRCALAAIYEPHPFRSCLISEVIGSQVDTGIEDDTCCWAYYDWCGNLIGLGEDMPEGEIVEKFTAENLGCSFKSEIDIKNYENLAEYLNMEGQTNDQI